MTATASFAAGTIKIGGLFAVTGPASFLGEPEKKTLELLVKEVNAKGGLNGMKLEAVIYDTVGDPTKAQQLATKLIKDDKVTVIIGPSTTGESMAIIPVVEKEKVPLISCAAGIKITDPVKRWVFKTPANDHVAAEKILNYMARQKQKSIALLTVTDGFGASGREQIKALAKQKGFAIVADEVYSPKDTDMTAQLTKIRGIKPDAIICWGTNPGPAVITKNVKQLGIKIPLYMSHGVASKKYIELAGGDAAEGVMLPAGKLAIYDVLPQGRCPVQTAQGVRSELQKVLWRGGFDLWWLCLRRLPFGDKRNQKETATLPSRSEMASKRPLSWSVSRASSTCPPKTITVST